MTRPDVSARALPAHEAYRLWAPTYADETAVSALDRGAVERLGPSPAGRVLLDAGCGVGRRLVEARALGAAAAVGVDFVEAMVRRAPGGVLRAVADVRALPFRPATFDLAWCRLVLGHLPDPSGAYAELARVLRPGGRLVVTDFHAEAAHAGHTRTFRDRAGERHTVEHHVHDMDAHRGFAGASGLALEAACDAPIGPSVRGHYEAAGALDRYRRDEGLPLVLAMAFRK